MRAESLRVVRAALVFAVLGMSGVAFAAPDEIHWTITGPTSVTFDWRGSAVENHILYGLSAGSYTSNITAVNPAGICVPFSSPGPFWEAKLTGLAADTLYHYSIGGGPDRTFRTAPAAGTSNFTILVQADVSESTSSTRMPVVQSLMALETSARFALVPGDTTYADSHGLASADQHFNDVMVWSRDVAYMPAWGNHEWEVPLNDDLRNYKGRFDFPNPQTSAGSPAVSNCGEDWYWFDYGNVRFIAYPEPYTGSTAVADWKTQAIPLMSAAQADPNIRYIVTFGHRPAYSSGHHPGSASLQGYLDNLAATYTKYVLNLNGHSHNYERSKPQDGSGTNLYGAVHITTGTGGSGLETELPACAWLQCSQPSWSATRFYHMGYLKLTFAASSITGTFVCGPDSLVDDVVCTEGAALDSFVLTPAQCRDRDGDGYGSPGDASCLHGAALDCDDTRATVYPGAPQVCDGLNNSCSAAGWPALSGTNEFDNDGDGLTTCAGDCNDGNPFCRDTCSDTDADGNCDDRDNCVTVANAGQANADGDLLGDACDTCTDTDGDGNGNPGFPVNTCPLDCGPTDPLIYHGAPERIDGKDNQCPGDSGYGLVDESTGVSGFLSPTNQKTVYSWPSQPGATAWQVGRADVPDFSLGCGTVQTAVTQWTDPQIPASGQVFYYLNRAVVSFVGSWGARSSGTERTGICTGVEVTIRDVKVAALADDAEESSSGSIILNSSDLDLTYDLTTPQRGSGLRFNGLVIPHGARILNAYVQFQVRNASSAAASLRIEAQNADNPGTFTATTADITGRSRTAAFVTWTPPAWTSGAGLDQRTPNISSVVREVVSRPGWVSGNSLVIIITGTGDRSAQSWDYASVNNPAGIPTLHVEYDGGGQ